MRYLALAAVLFLCVPVLGDDADVQGLVNRLLQLGGAPKQPAEVEPQDPDDAPEPPESFERPKVVMAYPVGNWCGACKLWKGEGAAGSNFDLSGLPFDVEFKPVPDTTYSLYPMFIWKDKRGKDVCYPPVKPTNANRVYNVDPQTVLKWWRFSSPESDKPPKAEAVRRTSDADAAPTPDREVTRGLALLNLSHNDKLIDPGCGDARWLIQAVRDYGCSAVGIEIDPVRAADARQRVETAKADRVAIQTGDALTADWGGCTAGCLYLYPDTLKSLVPKLDKLDRYVSYMHPVPGRSYTFKSGDLYFYQNKQPQTVSVVQPERPAAKSGGQWVQVWHPPYQTPGKECGNARCGMCYGWYSWEWQQTNL